MKTARWIGLAGESRPNLWIAFRRDLTLASVPESVQLSIACDSKYWLWINGHLAVFEGGLKRGPTPTGTYQDVVEIGPHLREGVNQVALLLWYFGKSGFSHASSGRAGLLIESPFEKLCSDERWHACPHPAYGDTGEPHPNYRLPESNIRFDATVDLPGWQTEAVDWPQAVVLGAEGDAPWGELVERSIPFWWDSGLRDYENPSPEVSDGTPICMRLPYNAQITPYLEVEAGEGQEIDIRCDNYEGGGPPNVRSEYRCRAGSQRYENLGWMNGHVVIYTMPKGVRITRLAYRETGYDCAFTGAFVCEDARLNLLREKSLRTLYITMRDTYFDCPDRERAQWWGDAVNELGEAFYALDPRSHLLARKGILELMSWQREDGSIRAPVPGNYDKELPMQMLASVGWYGFWTYAWHSGDLDTLRRVYPRVRRYLNCWQIGGDGLVIRREVGWVWGDWGDHKDLPILFNAWFYLALKGQWATANALGETEDLPLIEGRMASIKAQFNRAFWKGTAYRSPTHEGPTDDRAQALAVVSGLAQPEQYPAIRSVLREEEHASPYMEKYVLEALIRMGFVNDALDRIHRRYQRMLDHEFTTLFEGWGIGKEGFGGGTINHAWSGGPLTLMSEFLAGITPTDFGYRSFDVSPQMGRLTCIDCHVDSAAGLIKLSIRRTKGTTRIELTVPDTSLARLLLPGKPDRVSCNGTACDVRGGLQLGPGVWRIECDHTPVPI